jgi:acyl carrier protein
MIAEHLAGMLEARLALTTHTAFPPEADWNAQLARETPGSPLAEKIRSLRRIREKGAEVLILHADVGTDAGMQCVVANVLEKYGEISGVIYAAGVTRGEAFMPVQNIGAVECEAHFQAKCRGLYHLEAALSAQPLDFCIVFSSLSAILGGLGCVAYSASNSFADVFTHRHNRNSPVRWIVVNWDTWQTKKAMTGDVGATLANYVMRPAEAIRAFETALGTTGAATQLINSTGDLETRTDQWLRDLIFSSSTPTAAKVYPRPELSTPFVAPSSDVERAIASVWETLLGTTVGVHDHFLDLGGNSLVATRIVSRLRQAFQLNIPLAVMFEAPTIADMAVSIELALIQEIESLEENPAEWLTKTA